MESIKRAVERILFLRFKSKDEIYLTDVKEEFRLKRFEIPNVILLGALNVLSENSLITVQLTRAGIVARITAKGRSLLHREGGTSNE